MHIAHIAAPDLTSARSEQLAAMLALFRDLGLAQLVIAAPESGLEKVLEQAGIECRLHSFGHLFDLKAQKMVRDDLKAFSPHIIQSHSALAAQFVSSHLPGFQAVHVAFTDALPPSVTPALALHQGAGRPRSGKARFVVAPPLNAAAPESTASYLLAYKSLLAGNGVTAEK